ncbi:translation initiation factor IF-2 [Striga asiatica]|uniref:Translation initiation factor IF-2 n=1 Tax=Striga asiatica TaxID=4170 RepID=A0A5A7PYX5_STRAF|nr:translation initiation factor IF-2 [Striga asiatica]
MPSTVSLMLQLATIGPQSHEETSTSSTSRKQSYKEVRTTQLQTLQLEQTKTGFRTVSHRVQTSHVLGRSFGLSEEAKWPESPFLSSELATASLRKQQQQQWQQPIQLELPYGDALFCFAFLLP